MENQRKLSYTSASELQFIVSVFGLALYYYSKDVLSRVICGHLVTEN